MAQAEQDRAVRTDGVRTVLVTGATGFVGTAVRAALRAHGVPVRLRLLSRAAGGADTVVGDLADPGSLAGAATGADVLVHLAAQVAGDDAACAAVNVDGTTALLREARRAGVQRIVQLSTTAVYGRGPHHGIAVDGVAAAPVSAASRTRLLGERAALEAGAVVLRAPLMVGHGDRWVVPFLAELVRRVPARWAGGTAPVSMVAVEDLARLIAALALATGPLHGGVFHAGHPVPVCSGALLDALAGCGVLDPVPVRDWEWERCLARLAQVPGRVTERQFELVGLPHWYRSEEIWRLAGVDPGPGVLRRLPAAAPWYREHLGRTEAAGSGV
ncbi:NAD-dependent epimerase/dehydratase family protein [Kitasatospora sp. NPDC006697]|uniref:NAD-dependent epimerase/dehydratase family protein n=1 Tax=Kitasatospora sp. NPDC006697 TaxID=3364020 RepID=UPI0036A2709C